MKIKSNLGKKLLLGAVGSAILFIPIQQSFAQLEEIVVTARRYEESITDVPLALAVHNQEFLKDNRVASIQDILNLTPGGDWGQFAKAQPGLALRGISGGSFGNASLEHAVSVVYDGVPLTKAFMMTIPAYDLQRVEVLRGPQGTTFGRNATLGMMHFISARPSQDAAGTGSIESSIGADDLFGVNGSYNTNFSDTLSARIAFNYTDTPGAIEDEVTGDMIEYSENTSLRASFLYEPSDTFSAYVKVERIDDEEFPTVRRGRDQGITWLKPNYGSYFSNEDPWKATISPAPDGKPWVVTRDMTFLTAELSWALDNDLSVTSITGYQDGSHYSNSDAFGTPYDIRDQEVTNDGSVFSQEVRIDNQASGNQLRWLAGVSFMTDEEDRWERNESEPMRNNCNSNDPDNCFRNGQSIVTSTNTTDAYGLFGEITYDISEALTLAVGGRYSSDSRDLDYAASLYGPVGAGRGFGLGNPDPSRDCEVQFALGSKICGTPANPAGYEGFVSESWSNFSSKVSLSWAVSDSSNLYALYSEGFKAGGFQQDARNIAGLNFILEPEEATNYELGWKGSTDNLIWALTAFKQEQANVHTGNLVVIGSSQSNLLVNSEGVENTGFEIEATWAPNENLTIGGSIAIYDPKFKQGSQIAAPLNLATGEFGNGEDVSGTRPSGAIDEASYIFAAYEWQLAGGSSMRIRGDWRHRGDVWSQNGKVNRAGLNLFGDGLAYLRPSTDKLGLSLGWTSADQNLSVSLWGRNLDNKPDYVNFGPGFGYVYLSGPASAGAPKGVPARAVGSTGRRQIGATVRYNFGG